jgi:hypothetical protein
MRVHGRLVAARTAVALALLACSLPGRAAWTPVEGTANSYDYVDHASVRSEGTLRRVWTLHDLMEPDPEGDRSYRSLLVQPSAWRAVQPGSVSASIMAAVCTRP